MEVGEVAVNRRVEISLPCSTSRMIPMSVNSLETDPTRYTVAAVAGTPAAESAQPNPRAHTTRLPSTSAIETAGIPCSARCCSITAVSARATS